MNVLTCTLDSVLSVIRPGETVNYVELIARLKNANLPTAGVGMVMRPFTEPTGTPDNWLSYKPEDRQQHGELRCWRGNRFWDDENAGTWSAGSLQIARKPETR